MNTDGSAVRQAARGSRARVVKRGVGELSVRRGFVSMMKTTVKTFAYSYVGVLALLFFFQRKIIFPGTIFSSAERPQHTGGTLVRTKDGFVGLHFPAPPGKKTLVYFHGNADQLSNGPAHLGAYVAKTERAGFFAVEYPGFGISSGSISESNMKKSSEKLVRYLQSEMGVANEDIVLLGQSIGCVPAIALAAQGYGIRTVLVSPFLDLPSVALSAYPLLLSPVSWLLRSVLLWDKCDNVNLARSVESTTLVIHGDRDEIVPFNHGLELSRILKRARLRTVQGAHHNDVLNGEIIREILRFAESQ